MARAPERKGGSVKAVPFRRLLALAAPEARRLAIGTFFLGAASFLGLLYPQALRIVVDEALANSDGSVIDLAAVVMLGVFILQAVAFAIRYWLFTVAGERIVTDLRATLYESVMSQEIAFFDGESTGELMNRLSSDTTVLQNTVSVNISMGLRAAASVVGGLGFLFYTSVPLTGLMLLVVPPLVLGSFWYGRRVRRLSRRVQDALAVASESAQETILGIRTVRSFAAEKREGERYRNAVDRAFGVAKERASTVARFMGITSFFGYLAAALVLWSGGHLVIDGAMSVGELSAFLMYTIIVAVAIGTMSGLYADLMKASGAAERVFELLDRAPAMNSQPEAKPLTDVRGHVEFKDVGFAYPSRLDDPVLNEVSFTIAPGHSVALVGLSGSGKSTVARLLGRLYDPTTGGIFLDGTDLRELDPDSYRSQVGVVSQEPILFSSSVLENIRYARPDASREDVVAAAKAANAHEFVSGFDEGYETRVGERGIQLSGGQKQRVAIARALLKDPRVLILDEATSALDAEAEHLVQEGLDRLMRGRTTLIIAHRLSTVANSDRVMVIDGGRIVQQGPHDELSRTEGPYRRLLARQLVAA